VRFIRLLLPTLLLMAGCSTLSQTTPCVTCEPSYTLRHPDMNYTEFIKRADDMVKENYPEWYVEDLAQELELEQLGALFASVDIQEDGTLLVTIYEKSWDLCTVEDFASVLLHEYVHAKIWFQLEEEIEDEWCRAAMHEVTAYNVELTQTKINVTSAMLSGTEFGYRFAYIRAMTYCPREAYASFPAPGTAYNR